MTTNARLFVLCGLPGSGKTRLARRLEAEHGVVRLCPDEWLHQMDLQDGGWKARGAVEQLQKRLARALLHAGVSVAVEDGFWMRRQRDDMRRLAADSGTEAVVVFLDAPMEELWRRVSSRNGRPGGFVVRREDLESWSRGLERPGEDEQVVTADELARVLTTSLAEAISSPDAPVARSAG